MRRFYAADRLGNRQTLRIYLASGRQDVQQEDIDAVCCIYNPETQPFALSNAILSGDKDALLRHILT